MHQRPGGHGGRPKLPAMAVALEPAAQGDISTYYSATASLDPDKQADVLAWVNGVVKEIPAGWKRAAYMVPDVSQLK